MKWIVNKKYYLYCLIISFIILLFTSKNSFLYSFNDWVDANAFFTVGKSMFRGVVPYKELFEQKGIFLYFIYGIGSLFSNTSFHGVFILEVISFSVFLYFVHKLFSLYFDKKYSFIVLPVIAYLITTSLAFVHGGSCEEFALPYFMISIYYYFKHFKVKELSKLEVMLNGFVCGLVFLMKYTMIGVFGAFGLFIFLNYLFNKRIKDAFKFCMWFFIGLFVPLLIALIYLGINGAIKDFIECYFTINMTAYSDNSKSVISNLVHLPRGVVGALKLNGKKIMGLIFLLPIAILSITKKDYKNLKESIRKDLFFKLGIFSMFIFMILTIYWGLKYFTYYLLPINMFVLITILGVSLYFKKYVNKVLSMKYIFIIMILINLLSVFFSYKHANYKYEIGKDKDYYFQYKYADYINKYDKPTLLNMGFLDGGLYTTSGIVPNIRFFEEQNIDYKRFPDNLDSMRKYIENKDVKFVLFYTQTDLNWVKKNYPVLFKNYELVLKDKHYFEKAVMINAYLFKLKEVEK